MSNKITRKLRSVNEIMLRPLLRKIAGWNDIQEQLDSYHFFLNNIFDVSQVPKATGLLRKVQLADTELLRIVTEILDKNKLTYWLDCGTLIGAVRHQGFIPWDDDLDIAMPRKDFIKAFDILADELSLNDIELGQNPGRIWINIWDAGLVMDIFALDNVDEKQYSDTEELKRALRDYRRYYSRHLGKSEEFYRKQREKRIGVTSEDNPIWYHNIEGDPDYYPRKNSCIFPLRKIQFEDYQFYAPNDCEKYLTGVFGDYMSFPKKGVMHHSGGENKLIENSIKYDVNMDELIEYLQSV